jgi:hypothetical protein
MIKFRRNKLFNNRKCSRKSKKPNINTCKGLIRNKKQILLFRPTPLRILKKSPNIQILSMILILNALSLKLSFKKPKIFLNLSKVRPQYLNNLPMTVC